MIGWLRRTGRDVVRDRYILLLLLPLIAYYIVFKYLPMAGIVISFKQYSLVKGIWASDWVGLKYYYQFFNSPDALQIIRNTFLLGVYRLVFGFPFPIILAILLNEVRISFFKRFVQTVSYLPHFISTVVVAGMITVFLSPSAGVVNDWLQALGLEPINFMSEAKWFRTIYVTSGIWQEAGWSSIIYLAALTAINPTLYEAADIDGAGRWKKIRHVTLPGIAPAIIIILIMNIGSIIDIGFEKVFLLYNAATYETADIISTYAYRSGIVQGNFSYGTAIDLFMGIIGLVFVVGANYASRKLTETSLW
ncbi:sugar ABC transporter permease [Paenibacillus sp. PAMC21692]|uniref:ABC transporter permease n=1 Tax=Paenibacillus sp. PAMC21692 TaxID=2762320 RepID=UPI00164CF1F5|nr:ABC transporter permease subunit [Paenibacillus sp. PAMC21692]QNK57062.1 sugar ABC transporter permease [Paenibacillus sp. PAMC21692]